MRTTLLSENRQMLFSLRRIQSRIAKATVQISSGLRVNKPSDSPADAAGVVRTQSELRSLAQFRANLESVQAELRAVDGALARSADTVTRALTLAAQASSIAGNTETRNLIRIDLEGIFRGLVRVANSTYSDRFLFAGNTNDQAPFEIDPGSPDGVVYRGDSSSRSIAFPDGRLGQISLPGNAIFARPDNFVGSGRSPGNIGSAAPSPPVAVGVAFSGDVDGVISADVDGFFVATAPPSVAAGGETITVNFTAADGSISSSITTAPLAGGETTAQIAALLNTEIGNDPSLVGGFTFSDEGGNLKLVQSDTLGVGFSFTSSATGGLTTGLEGGGVTGGQSAEEIAAALNGQVALNSELSAARVTFTVVDGEVQVDGEVDFEFTAIDFDRNVPPGTGFQSGLAGTHIVGGRRSANVFGVLNGLIEDLKNDNTENLDASIDGLQRAVDQIGAALGFYGSTLRQIDTTIDNLSELDLVYTQRLSSHQDADLLDSISELTAATTAEQFTLQVAARQRPNLLDLLA